MTATHPLLLRTDIAGFTSWSSNRQPQAVFQLLETYFGAFDALAAKLDVFKVETIGDCCKYSKVHRLSLLFVAFAF